MRTPAKTAADSGSGPTFRLLTAKAAAPTSATTAPSGRRNWDAPDLIRTYQDAKDNLIMPAAWRDERDDEADDLYD